MTKQTLRSGIAARFDAFTSGLVPVKVMSISGSSGPCSTAQRVMFRVTRNHGPYKAGETLDSFALHVIPVKSLRHRKYGTTILPYDVACDTTE